IMGNYISCSLAINSSKGARVILPSGEVRQFREPVKAAELMLECPNFFLADSKSLHIGRRFSSLSADEELEFGSVYIMFPMRRVNSVVTAVDMAALFMAANSAAKRISGATKVRISPESGSRDVQERRHERDERLEEGENGGSALILEGFPLREFQYRLVSCRSRKPMLETIKEEPVCSR
ncbi:DUF4228 domain-containing protein, partial [Cephalotus follicularis]